MFYKIIETDIPLNYSSGDLRKIIAKKVKTENFSFSIERKSLDARNKRKIHWHFIIKVVSDEIKGDILKEEESFEIPILPKNKRNKKVVVVGSGPAGIFSAIVLQKSGFKVFLFERGEDVKKREHSIENFEKTQIFNPNGNYAFGEGGAGTFSDGKLTSRTKRISLEKKFIFEEYIKAGAPKEILYLTHPHLGSDNLKIIVENLRKSFIGEGGEIFFETFVSDVYFSNNKIKYVDLKSQKYEKSTISADYFVFATGHSAFDTYKMLMRKNVPFKTKGFALGFRVEHKQKFINISQWGKDSIPFVKAAEYRLTAKIKDSSVYSFCMCPGGKIVPATAFEKRNIVNGMSNFSRGGEFGNSAVVTALKPELLNNGLSVSPLKAIDLIDEFEQKVFDISKNYNAPANKISDFLRKKVSSSIGKSSFPFDLYPYDFRELFPKKIILTLEEGLNNFASKLKYFKEGNLIGLETKTSSSIQVLRDKTGFVEGFENLLFCGEGSGFSGGIISSAADGINAAKAIIKKELIS